MKKVGLAKNLQNILLIFLGQMKFNTSFSDKNMALKI